MLKNKILSAVGSGEEKLYSDDVFSAHLRTGTGADTVVNTGIDMTKGYMLWSKSRSAATDHAVYDSARGVTLDLATNTSAAQTTQATGLKAVSSTGHTVGSLAKMNTSGATYVDFVFRRAPKFFDVVTYTGNGVAGRQIPHSLGVTPGMIIVKSTSNTTNWAVNHASLAAGNYMKLNATDGVSYNTSAFFGTHTSTTFQVGSDFDVNTNGYTYVAYLFAHDPSAEGIIQCGSFTTSGNATVTLGWEPQFLLTKRIDLAEAWYVVDTARGWSYSSNDQYLNPNSSAAEGGNPAGEPTATGFRFDSATGTYIYLTIRRPNKPPTSGTQVFRPVARTGTGVTPWVASGAGFPPDMTIMSGRNGLQPGPSYQHSVIDRLRRATEHIQTVNINAEGGGWGAGHIHNVDGYDGLYNGDASFFNVNASPYIDYHFKRAPGVFDVVCYSGTGANKTEAHSLGVQPQLWLVKRRNNTGSWTFGSTLLNANEKIVMPSPNGRVTDATVWNSAYPTATHISLGTQVDVNQSGGTYVAYLWASLSGVSRVFTYTGNGTSQTVDCGFTTGARFVMIIRTTASTAQDIYIWDSARGIVAANDPRLSLNTDAAEDTTLDTIDPTATGFVVNQDASNVNVNGAVYIGLAYA